MSACFLLFLAVLPALTSSSSKGLDCSSLPILLRNLKDGTFPAGMSACEYLQSEQELSCCLWEKRDSLPPPAIKPKFREARAASAKYDMIGPFTPSPLCSESTLQLSCSGKGVKLHIDRATFGRTDSKTCSMGIVNHAELAVTNCEVDVLKQVRARCEGRDECKLTATTRIFGDPCAGTNKYLSLQYSCIPGFAGTALAAGAELKVPQVEESLVEVGTAVAPLTSFNLCPGAFKSCSGFTPTEERVTPLPLPTKPANSTSGPITSPITSPTTRPTTSPTTRPTTSPTTSPDSSSSSRPLLTTPKPSAGHHEEHSSTGFGMSSHVVPRPAKPTAASKKVAKLTLKFEGHSLDRSFARKVISILAKTLGFYSDELMVLGIQESSLLEAGAELEHGVQARQQALVGWVAPGDSNPTTTLTIGVVADTPEQAEARVAQILTEWNKLQSGASSQFSDATFPLTVASVASAGPAATMTVYQCPDGTTSVSSACEAEYLFAYPSSSSSAGSHSSAASSSTAPAGPTSSSAPKKSAAHHLFPITFVTLLSVCITYFLQ